MTRFMWACFSKRCKTCQTLYQSRMSRIALVLVALVAASVASAKSKHFALRVHVQGNAKDSSVFAIPITTPISRKAIFIEKMPRISERDVRAFRAYRGPDGSFGALFQLDDHGRLALETLSTERLGGTLVVMVNGRVLTELSVDRRVSDGQLYIASGLTAAEVGLMEKDWPQIGAKKRR
jgi:hypothetical protein